MVDFVRQWSDKTDIAAKEIVAWLGVRENKFYDWRSRYGKVNEHNAWIPRDLARRLGEAGHPLCQEHPLDGYRRMTFDMIDKDIVCVSPSSVECSS